MDAHLTLLSRLAQPAKSKIVLLVLDGVGGLRSTASPRTALDAAAVPHLDALAACSAVGRTLPVASGVTPGSGPGHLALFGYDPAAPEADIGRGVLEALGLELSLGPGDVAARCNFATADLQDGRKLLDRRAGRPSTEENRRLCGLLRAALEATPPEGVDVEVASGEGHRFVLIFRGEGLSPELRDTDPQKLGGPALVPAPKASVSEQAAEQAQDTAARVQHVLEILRPALTDEDAANEILMRGFSSLPHLPQWGELYQLRAGAFAGYPLYRGVAAACGMEVVPCGKRFADLVDTAAEHWDRFDFFFLHLKQTDAAGEDGDLAAKAAVLEEVDRDLPRLLELLDPEADVICVTGDHSTPAPMKAHSWHPVPTLISGPRCFVDEVSAYTEVAALGGHLGTFPARDLVGLMLANAGRLKKYGA